MGSNTTLTKNGGRVYRNGHLAVHQYYASRSETLLVTPPGLALLCLPTLDLTLIRMLGRIEHIDREFQEYCSLQKDRNLRIQLRWKGDEDARSMQISLICWPVVTLLVPLLRSWSFLQCQPGDEHEQYGQEECTEYGSIEGRMCTAAYVAVCCW